MSDNAAIVLDYRRDGHAATGVLTAKLGDETLAVEKLDIARSTQRDAFAKQVAKDRPGIDRSAVAAELLRLAGEAARAPEPTTTATDELDVSCIVRPELFHVPDVSGFAIPTAMITGGKPVGRWLHYLRWADGRRERRELAESIKLPDGGRLWLHPLPAAPLPTAQPGWSTAGRLAWLEGAEVPSAATVFKRLCERFAYFLEFHGDTAGGDVAVLALWTLLSYCYPAWSVIPYLRIGGPLACGKTRGFELLRRLVFRGIQSSNMTAACLFRSLHETGGTLLLDEAERLRDRTPDAGELRSILLSGYKAGSPARRLEPAGDGRFIQRSFDVYGLKAIASIANLPEALASRCIPLTMFRAAATSPKPRRRIDRDMSGWASLRDDLHALALEHGLTWLQLAERADVCPEAMTGRAYELWQPLLALAAFAEQSGADGLLATLRRHALYVTELQTDDSTPDTDELLLRLLADDVTGGSSGNITPGELLRRARDREPSLFSKWSARGVSAALKRYKVPTKKRNGRKVYREVTVTQLCEIEAAYSIDLGLSTCPTCPTCPDPASEAATERASQGT